MYFRYCQNFKILFRIQWIPRTLLTDVDALSRKTDFDDWETIVYLFEVLNRKMGTFQQILFCRL